MNRILILNDNLQDAQEIEKCVLSFDNIERTEIKIALTVEDALTYINMAVQSRLPYTVFLIDQTLGPDNDCIETMKEMLVISPNTDAVIINGFNDSSHRIRAYEAGARHYLLESSELREITFILRDLAQMQRKRRELESKSIIAAQTSWAAELAHEINHEIYKIQTAAYLIKGIVPNDSDVFRNAEIILESAESLANVGQYRDQASTIFEVDKDIRIYAGGLCEKRGIALEFSLNATSVRIECNKVGFRYILKQLIDNAAHAMRLQEVKKIYIFTEIIDGGGLEIRFRDSGPGINDDLQQSIFQWPITTKERGGYGLLLIRQVVEDMNGEIILRPYNESRGAEFVIHVPYVRAIEKALH